MRACVAAAIIERARLEPEVKGANLGMAVKRAVPSANMKEYGGLRRFIEQFCPDKLHRVRKHGLDDVYASTAGTPPPQETQASSALAAWQALTNPTSTFSAFVNTDEGTLKVLPDRETPPSGLVQVPKITAEEHRGIAQAFLSKLDPADRAAFEEVLKTDNYWQRWVRHTNTFDRGKYRGEWIAFRRDQIIALLKTKLVALGLSGPLAESALQAARDSKGPNPLAARSPAFTRHAGRLRGLPLANRRLREDDLKRLAHQAIDRMGEDEVRKLRIPLGAVIDALRTRRL